MKGSGRLIGVFVAAALMGGGGLVRQRRAGTLVRAGPATVLPKGGRPLPFELEEVSAQVGVVNVHAKFVPHPTLANIAPMLSALAGASVAVADYDGDGWPDIYLTNAAVGSRNKLFRNNRDGTFTEVAEKAGVADVNQDAGSLRALFFDYDNDGHPDLLLNTTWCPKLFHNNGDGTFTDVTKRSGLDHCGYALASNAVDYDGDGYLDLVIADYYKPVDLSRPSTTKFIYNRVNYADNGGPIHVYHNNRDGTFSRVPDSLGIRSRGWSQAVGVYDLRGTGRPDLYFATDFNQDQVYFHDGRGRYRNASAALGKKYSGNGMSAEIADLDGDGLPAVFVSDLYEPGQRPGHNALWKADGERFTDRAWERGIPHCGWGWGAKFLDLDNDGRLDLVVTNGFLSADRAKDYWYMEDSITGGNDKVHVDARLWTPMGDSSMSGYQYKCVYHNRGDRFEEVSESTGMRDDDSDGRGLAAIDYRNDGSLSLVEANFGQPVRFYRNVQRNRNHWIGFDLVGTLSNRDAFGAQVRVRLKGGPTLARELEPANGFESQSDRRLHFGLGPEPAVESVTIRWPSGASQTLKGPAVDRYHTVREPR